MHTKEEARERGFFIFFFPNRNSEEGFIYGVCVCVYAIYVCELLSDALRREPNARWSSGRSEGSVRAWGRWYAPDCRVFLHSCQTLLA